MEKAFLVLGPEGSGNRLWMELLIAAGCVGDAGYWQRFDVTGQINRFNPAAQPTVPICWFRSFPHRNEWACPAAMAADVARRGWEPFFLLLVREPAAVAGSQSARGWRHGSPELQLRRAWESVLCSGWRWRLAVYEAVLLGGLSVVNRVLSDVGLPGLGSLPCELVDGNCKHFS